MRTVDNTCLNFLFTLSTLSNLLRYLAKLSVAEADETSVVNDVLDEVAEQRELRAGLLEKSTGSEAEGWLVSALEPPEPRPPPPDLLLDVDLPRLEE